MLAQMCNLLKTSKIISLRIKRQLKTFCRLIISDLTQ